MGHLEGLSVVRERLRVVNESGMHLRACSAFVKLSSRFGSRILLTREDQGLAVDGKSIMGLLSLAAEPGAELVLQVEGPDEVEAAQALRRLVEEGFGLGEG
jgi:phosphocarrier protein